MSDEPDDTEADPFDEPADEDPDEDRGLDDTAAQSEGDADDEPLADLKDVAVEEDPFGGPDGDVPDDEFDEIAVDDIDESSVWEALGAEDDDATDVAVGGELPEVDTAPREQIVPKRSYCEKCEHFSAPPETACTHPGTEIRQLVDMEHFTVANCPVVEQRRGLDYSDLPSDDSADD